MSRKEGYVYKMQQLKSLSCLALACILLPFLVHGNSNDTDYCSLRQILHNSVSDKLKVNCALNDLCTAVHCQGIFLKDIISSGIKTKQNDTICFGTIINQCDVPMSMDVYLQYDAMNYALKKRLYNNLSIPLYGRMSLYIELSHAKVNSNKGYMPNIVTIKVALKIKIVGHSILYALVPERTYTLPSCPDNANVTQTPLPEIEACHPPPSVPHTGQPDPHAGHSEHHQHHHSEETVQNKTQFIQSGTYGKPCNPKLLYSCSKNETCTFSNICECQTKMVINPISGFCDLLGAQPSVDHSPVADFPVRHSHNISAHPLTANVDSSPLNNSALITGLSVGAAVLLGSIILVAFIIWKRQKNQNSHVPLIDNEEVVI